jgi:Mg-chelatase subunit ChlD
MGRHGLDLVHSNSWEKHHELPIHGIRSERQMHRLISKLTESQQSADRIQHLVYEIKSSSQPFSGDQVIALAAYFPGTELVLVLHLLDNHLFGLRCDQAVQLLQMIQAPEERFEALQIIDENLLDPVNRFQLRNLFPSDLLVQVDQILADTRGQSHLYGSITSSRVIFLIDTSRSMNTEFQTHCGQHFNRLQYIVHDLHKLLHHRVQPNFKFNIIHFNTHVHRWKHSLTSATSEHLKQAEHYLDHIEADGETNTYDALKLALSDEEADTIYLLSDGKPSVNTNTILSDLKVWLKQRRNPCVIHTIVFLMGHSSDDPRPRKFMAEIAAMTGGVFRCMDPLTPLNQEFDGDDSFSEDPDFDDDEFVDYFHGKLRDVPPQLLQNVGLRVPNVDS